MAKSELFSTLNEISFAEKDPAQIEQEIISQYENLSGRTLAKGDPVRVFFDSIILAIIQQRNLIDKAAKNNLLAYATGNYLDHIGAMLGVSRLGAAHAACVVKFTLSSPQSFTVKIPAGTRITPDGKIFFAVDSEQIISAGELETSCACTCLTAGEAGNGFVAGQINKLVDIFPYEMNASNTTESTGGSEIENDENFRERIHIAPESFTTAGSDNAYKYFARSANSDIIDVAVLTPPATSPGCVEIIPLMTGGAIPSDEIIQSVYETCNASDVRPDTDYLTVSKPEEVKYNLTVYYWLDKKNENSASAIISKVETAINSWVLWQRQALGRDINPSELNKRILEAGAKRCEIDQPKFTVLYKKQIASLNAKNIYYAGVEES